jgi:hypothetical protein
VRYAEGNDMGMVCEVWQIAEETVQDLVDDPSIGREVLSELREYNEELPQEEKIVLSLDKAWDGINFVTDYARLELPKKFLTHGGTPLPAIDLGFGPARYYTPKEVAQMSKVLEKASFKSIGRGLSVSDLLAKDVYPFEAHGNASEALEYIEEHWGQLVDFVKLTAAFNRGLMIYLF